MNDAVEDEYIHEGKEMHSDDMTDEEAMMMRMKKWHWMMKMKNGIG